MNKENKDALRTIRSKKILALVSAVAIGIAMFAGVGMLSSPQQAEASHKIVLKFGGVVSAPDQPIRVGGRVSGVDFDSLTGQSFDIPVTWLKRFYCTIELTSSGKAGAVVTLSGNVIQSNFPSDPPSDPSPVIGTPVIFTVNLDTGDITFKFGAGATRTGTGHVRIAGHQ